MYYVQLYTYQLQDRYVRSLYRRPVQIPKNIQDLTIHRPHRCYGSNGHHFISRLHKYILKLFFIAVPKERQKSVFDSFSLQRYNFSRFFFLQTKPVFKLPSRFEIYTYYCTERNQVQVLSVFYFTSTFKYTNSQNKRSYSMLSIVETF